MVIHVSKESVSEMTVTTEEMVYLCNQIKNNTLYIHMRHSLFSALLVLGCMQANAQQLPYQNPQLSNHERAVDLCSRLTLEEKSQLMLDVSPAIPRLGIKEFNWWSEALHGLANQGNVTVFPEPIGMAASFNDELVQQVFTATSDETRAKYNEQIRMGIPNTRFHSLSVWTPNVNIFRDPRWGRGQETYGEDPYLTSRMGLAVVRGLQGPEDARYRKLLACAKHYAIHSGPEWSRHSANLTDVSVRDLYETYLPAFKVLVQEGKVREVMCAYQRWDDEPCCGSTKLLQKILRDDWGFQYMVVSDCGAISDFHTSHHSSPDAVHAAATGTLAGTDVECGYDYAYKHLPEAVANGLITEAEIDRHVIRLLEGRFDLGEMDEPALNPWSQIPASVLNCDAHRQLALDMARQSIVLLQNTDNILPLPKDGGKIAVIGPNAADEPLLWGNYNGTPNHTVSILDGIQEMVGKERVFYTKGCDLVDDRVVTSLLSCCAMDGKSGIRGTFWNNPTMDGESVTTEYFTNPINVTTSGQHTFATGVQMEDFSGRYETQFTAPETEEVVIRMAFTSAYELYLNGKEISHGRTWRTDPVRIPLQVEKGKTYNFRLDYSHVKTWGANLQFNIGRESEIDYDSIIRQLDGISTVIYVGGISAQLEGEEMPVDYEGFKGGDRTSIELPAVQRNLLARLKAAGKDVVYVNCSGSAIALTPETQNCKAIVQAWYPGELGGRAVAEVLFGDVNPSGKLPVTFYRDSSQLPDYEDYDMHGRTYRYFNDTPLYPFGYGLSYTSFAIGKAKLSKKAVKAGESVNITIPVSNTGSKSGTEVLQVYVRNTGDPDGPSKTLKAFQRVELNAGQSTDVTITLTADAFTLFDPNTNTMRIQPNNYEIYYGNCADDNLLQKLNLRIK